MFWPGHSASYRQAMAPLDPTERSCFSAEAALLCNWPEEGVCRSPRVGLCGSSRVSARWLAEHRIEVKLNLATRSLLRRIHHTRIEWSRVNVKADRALVECARIHHPMYRVCRVHRARIREIHLNGFGRLQPALTALQILLHEMKILHLQTAKGDSHPAILVAMIVYRTGLADFPADGHQLVKRSPVDQVSRVVLPVPGKKRA